MEEHPARYETGLERLERKMAEREREMAKRDVEMAKRDKQNLRWQIGLWVAAVVILGILIRWPA